MLIANPEVILNAYSKFNNLKQDNSKKISILVSYVKPSFLFKNDIFTPIHLGREIEREYSKFGTISNDDLKWLHNNCIGDNDFKDNISRLNRRVGFLTGTYWAWKNYDKLGNPDYFGSYGYRKLLSPSFLDNLYDYDLVLPKKTEHLTSLKKQMIDSHGLDMYEALLKVIKNTYPNEVNMLEEYLHCDCGYFYELYVMSKYEFFKFCDWIFPILNNFYATFKGSKINNTTSSDLYKKVLSITTSNVESRDIAFIIERITGYYLYKTINKKNIRYCEVDVLFTDEAAKEYNNKVFAYLRKKRENNA